MLRWTWLGCVLALACSSSSGDGEAAATAAGGQAGAGGGAQAGSAGKAQAGASQAGSAGSAQAGSAGSTQAGAAGSAQAGAAGSAQAGAAGSAQAGAAGSAQAGAAGGGQGGAAGSGPRSTGLIVMASIPPNAALPDGRGLVTASFVEDQPDTCERETVGGCTLSRCPTAAAPSSAPPDAGEITVETGVKFASLSPNTGVDPGTYASYTSQSVLYYGGELVKVAAKGGGVPAFSGTVFAPDTVSFTKPYTKPGDSLTLDSTKDYACEWSPTTDDVRFGVSMKDTSSGASTDVELSCTFDGATGAGTVPQALLAKLPKKLGSLSVSARNQTVVTAGKYEITLRALAPAYGPTGASITTEVVVK